jgi:hypothetical protein
MRARYLLDEEATPLCRKPTVKLQSSKCWEPSNEAMGQVIDWWGDLPPPMKEAIEQFRTQLGAAIDPVEFVRRALDRQVHEMTMGKDLPGVCCGAKE